MLTGKDLKVINRQEIEEAVEALLKLPKNGFYNIPKITWWLLYYEELFTFAYDHRHDGSGIENIGCGCSWNNPESRLSDLYSGLQDVVDLHQYEIYFKKEIETYDQVGDDNPALMQWLKKNEKLGTEEFILFWIEWYEEDGEIVKPFILNWQDLDINFTAQEWQHTIRFLRIFNEIYWTSDACPPIEKSTFN